LFDTVIYILMNMSKSFRTLRLSTTLLLVMLRHFITRQRPFMASAFVLHDIHTQTRTLLRARRWMTTDKTVQNTDNERTEEEKAAIKAAREAKKYVHHFCCFMFYFLSILFLHDMDHQLHTSLTYPCRAEKDRLHAEKMEKQQKQEANEQERNQPIPKVTYLAINEQNTYPPMGDMTRVMSRSRTLRNFVKVSTLEDSNLHPHGSTVWIRGRVHSIRVKGGSAFLVVRQDSFHTIQTCFFKDKSDPDRSAKMLQYLKSLTMESVIDLEGRINTGVDVKSCSVKSVELTIQRIHSVSNAAAILPFLVEDAARSESEIDASQNTDRPFPVSFSHLYRLCVSIFFQNLSRHVEYSFP